MKRTITTLMAIALLCLFACPALAHHKRALLISSYHPGFPTFFQQIDGIKSVLNAQGVSLDVEFMDSKRFFSPKAFAQFRDLLKSKLDTMPPYDVIITSDDNALNFALRHRKKLFPETPVVFCGVNNQILALSLSANPNFTGVIESVSMEATIAMIKQLIPGIGTIYAIVDSTPSGQGDLQEFRRMKTLYPLQNFDTLSLADQSWDELSGNLSQFYPNDALLILSAYRDNQSINKLFNESLSLITAHARSPIFHLWEHGMGDGILGGKIVSHFEQGRLAAVVAMDVINGKPVAEIPVLGGDRANQYIVDQTQLTRFGIPTEKLPLGTKVLNKPISIFELYNAEMLAIIVGITALCIIVVILLVALYTLKKSRAALEESERRHRIIFEKSPLGMILFDAQGEIVDCNDNFVALMGATKEQLLGFNTAENSSPKMRYAIQRALAGSISVYEGEYTSVTGKRSVNLRVIFNPVTAGKNPTAVIATLEDINNRETKVDPRAPKQ